MTHSVLKGAPALVTGAGSGIGRAISLELARYGAKIMIVGRRAELLNETAAMIGSAGGVAIVHALDITDDEAIRQLARSVEKTSEARLAVLVHCAGQHSVRSIEGTSPQLFDSILRTNLRAPFILTRALLPLLRRAPSDIVFVNSSAAINPRAEIGAYAASKAALNALADSLRAEVNRDGIRVLSVFPGRTATPLQEELFAHERRPYDPDRLLQPETIATTIVNALLMPRSSELTDIQIRPAQKI